MHNFFLEVKNSNNIVKTTCISRVKRALKANLMLSIYLSADTATHSYLGIEFIEIW